MDAVALLSFLLGYCHHYCHIIDLGVILSLRQCPHISQETGYGKLKGSLAGTRGSEGRLSTTLARASCRPAIPLLCILAGRPLGEIYQRCSCLCFVIVLRNIQLPSLNTHHLQRDPETLCVSLAPYSQHAKHKAKVNRVLLLLRLQGSKDQPEEDRGPWLGS